MVNFLDQCFDLLIISFSILALQWKQDVDKALEYLNKAVEMDEKCQFGFETLGTIEVQRCVYMYFFNSLKYIYIVALKYFQYIRNL